MVYIEVVENSMVVLQKKKKSIKLPYDPAIPLVDKYPKEQKAGTQTDTHTPVFTNVHNNTVHNSQKVEAIQMPTNG